MERPEVIEAVVTYWNGGRQRLGLLGMGGSGKTVLATTIAGAAATRELFPDGVLWVTVGHANPLAVLGVLAAHLTDSPPAFQDAITGRQAVKALAAGRKFLLVLDDIWTDEQALALDVVDRASGILATSRHRPVLERLGAVFIEVAPFSNEKAAQLLANWGGNHPPSPETAIAIAQECGNLPLALAMAGALARRPHRSWNDALRLLRDAKLNKLEARFPEYPYPNLLAAIEVSVRDLSEDDQRHYLELAVFENEWVPSAVLERFWSDEDLVTTLIERSLAFLDADNRLRLHDLQADYVRLRAGDVMPIHRALVESFRGLVAGGGFGNATPDLADGYFFERLPHHLAAAGLFDELRRLVFDFHWLSAKLAATDVNALIADCALLPGTNAAQALKKALRLASPALAADHEQLAGQLLSRLVAGDSDLTRLLDDSRAYGTNRTWLRPMRPGLNRAGAALQQRFQCGESIRKLVYRGNGILDAFSFTETIYSWDIEFGTVRKTDGPADPGPYREPPPECATMENAVWAWLDPTHFVAAEYRGVITVWNVATGTQEIEFKARTPGTANEILSMAVLDPRHVVTGSLQSSVCLWDVVEGRFVQRLAGHSEKISCLVRIDDEHFASATHHGDICIWDVTRSALEIESQRHSTSIRALAATRNGVISNGYDELLFLHDLEGSGPPRRLRELAGWMRSFVVLDDHLVAAFAIGGGLCVWDLRSCIPVYEFEYGGNILAMARLNEAAFVAGAGREVHVWSASRRALLNRWNAHEDTIRDLAVLQTNTIVTASLDKTMRAWDLGTGRELASLTENVGLNVTAAGDRGVAFIANEGRICIWDWTTGRRFELSDERYSSFTLGSRGNLVSAISRAGALAVFDVSTRNRVTYIPAEIQDFKDAQTVWLDDDHLVSGSKDRRLRVWNVRTGQCDATSFADGPVTALDVLPGSNVIVAGDDTGNVQVLAFESV